MNPDAAAANEKSAGAARTVCIRAACGALLRAPLHEAAQLGVLAPLLEGLQEGAELPLPDITGEHVAAALAWVRGDREAVLRGTRDMPAQPLFALMNAVDFLALPEMLDELCRQLADRIRGLPAADIATALGLPGGATAAEAARRAQAQEQHRLAFATLP